MKLSYWVMTAEFAVPVLRCTTAVIIQTCATTETSKTTNYCQMLDQIFD